MGMVDRICGRKECGKMIRINQIKMKPGHSASELEKKIAKKLKIPFSVVKEYRIVKRSIDARKKEDILYIYSVNVDADQEKSIVDRAKDPNVILIEVETYTFVSKGTEPLNERPVIVGSGPAGLFCAYLLAKEGYCPILLERGEDVDARTKSVEHFWQTGELKEESNVQFGEGGAGTFSDGKLNTMVKDPTGRNLFVLRTFVEAGAEEEILYVNKPHLGTDKLTGIVKNMRNSIIEAGGEVRFQSKVTDIRINENKVTGLEINGTEHLKTDVVILAIGHSARDTFQMLKKRGVFMSPKSFAIGVRVEHPQAKINRNQYGDENPVYLGAADYKVTCKTKNGRGVYSFCMCPGGYVVNASSQKGMLAINGMSYAKRDSQNANSAIIVSVTPQDFDKNEDPLCGLYFQQQLEEKAYTVGKGNIPVQLYGDFKRNHCSDSFADYNPCIKGKTSFGNLREIFPEYINESLMEAMEYFNKSIEGFAADDVIMSGVESRTSSPIRLDRNEDGICNIEGLYPAGEGAGYAGGITSAAMDGMKAAEKIAGRYRHEYKQEIKR